MSLNTQVCTCHAYTVHVQNVLSWYTTCLEKVTYAATYTLTDHEFVTNLGQNDHWVCPHMSHDCDLHLIFDLNIGVNAKFGGYIFYASQKSEFYLFAQWWALDM